MEKTMQSVIRKLALCFILIGITSVNAAESTSEIVIKSDRASGLYKVGEKSVFSISLLKDNKPMAGKKLTYLLKRDGFKDTKETLTTTDKPVTIETQLDNPGFTLCKVEYNSEKGKKIKAYAGVGYEPEKIKVGADAPTDFDTFWGSKTQSLDKEPLEVKMVPVKVTGRYANRVECFDIKVNCPGSDKPISGYLLRPINSKKKSLPAMITYHGAGVRSSYKALWRASTGMVVLDVNAHGIDNGQPKDYYTNLNQNELKNYQYVGFADREKIYFKGMFLRVYRALQLIKSQPEWNGKTLIAYGSSQGGGQAIVAAALDPQVSYCIARIPALSDHHGINAKRQSGWPKFITCNRKYMNKDPKSVSEAIGYYDAAHFASRIKCPATITTGFIDTVCSPSSVYAAYNNIKTDKNIINNVTTAHTNPLDASKQINSIIKKHITASK